MKLEQIIVVVLIVALSLVNNSCKDGKGEINNQKELLTSFTKANEDDMSKQQIMLDGESIPIYNEDGERLRGVEMMKTLMSGDFIPDFYKDKNNTIKVAVLRKATEEEKQRMKEMQTGMKHENTEINKDAVPFSANDIKGNNYSLEHLKGKIIVMNFWFVECKPCVIEMPELNTIVKKYENENVVFLGFATSSEAKIESFLKKNDFSYQIIPDSKKIASNYGVSGYPTHIIVDENSKIVFSTTGLGANTISNIENTIEGLVKK